MRVVDDVRAFHGKTSNLCLTIGSFDGIHLGHQRIVRHLKDAAKRMDGTAALMTLRPHPRQYFAPNGVPNLLTGDTLKERLLKAMGVDILFVLPFNAATADMDRSVFLEDIVLRRCGARHLIVGHDFAFGKNAGGDHAYLAKRASALGYTVEEVPPLIMQGERISSTLIREALLQGALDQAEKYLGRRYTILGEVARGRGIGRKLGFPTANIRPGPHIIPAHGVYAAEAIVTGRRYMAAVNIGIAPTIRHEDITIEAFLIDFDGDIVGETLELIFYKRLRPEVKFADLDSLVRAINQDVETIRDYFQALGPDKMEPNLPAGV